jgi:hypothetical protein
MCLLYILLYNSNLKETLKKHIKNKLLLPKLRKINLYLLLLPNLTDKAHRYPIQSLIQNNAQP